MSTHNLIAFQLIIMTIAIHPYDCSQLPAAPAKKTGLGDLWSYSVLHGWHNWLASAKERRRRSVFHVRWQKQEKHIVQSPESPAVNSSDYSAHPRRKLSKFSTKLNFNPKLYQCFNKFDELCRNKTLAYRNRILKTFQEQLSLSNTHNDNASPLSDDQVLGNFYNVNFSMKNEPNFEDLYYPPTCLLMEAGVDVLKRKDAPFNKIQFGKLFPKRRLIQKNRDIETCAIVSSAGALANSKLGRFIDSHDVVMRFNDAPTEGYEKDVGRKTSIRVVNSQVVAKPEFQFTTASIFRNVIIAAWDSGKYNGSLEDWLTTADYDLFNNYEIYRRRNPKSRAFLLNPRSVWRLWQTLQTFIGHRAIVKNPPSSGFIGLALLLPICPIVHFIEYMPSTRLTGRCHYYSKEINTACTFGSWHPLAAEKLMALSMNVADDMSVFQFGIMRIQRPSQLMCGFSLLGY